MSTLRRPQGAPLRRRWKASQVNFWTPRA